MTHSFRRFLSVLLSVLLLTGTFAGCSFAEDTSAPVLTEGTVIHGFRVWQTDRVDYLGTDLYFMEHEKTGAQLIYAANDDQERTFGVAFRTASPNDEGLPHVFEHTALSGSDKYPDPNLLFSMMNQTYNEYINAETRQFSTLYPISSYSEDQLFADMDLYMNGVLHPAILTDERVMMREAWHYNLDDPDSEITISGVVYSEVAGASSSLQTSAAVQLKKVLFPGSHSSNDPGGITSVIPDMTWQELKDFHALYYHPSNMLLMLYGDFSDIGRFLEHLDREFLSGYDRVKVPYDDPDYVPAEGYQELYCSVPAAEGTPTGSAAYIDYAFVLQDMTREDYILASVAVPTLTDDSSAVSQRMTELFPSAFFSVALDRNTVQPTLHFALTNADAENAQDFKAAVDEMLPVIASGDLNEAAISKQVNSDRYGRVTVREQAHAGVNFFSGFVDAWAVTGCADAGLEDLRVTDDLEARQADGSIAAVLGGYLTSSPASAMIVAVPEPGLAEKNAADLAARLADMKAAMTPEDLQALLDQCADYNAWLESNAAVSLIDRMKVVDAADLPEEFESVPVTDVTENGVRYLTSEIPDCEIFEVTLYLDAQGIAIEDLIDATVAFSLLDRCGTENYSFAELTAEKQLKTNSLSFANKTVYFADGTSRQYLCLHGDGLTGQLEDTFRLMEEIALHIDFNDYDALRNLAWESLTATQMVTAYMPEMLMGGLSKAAADPACYGEYYSGYSMENYFYLLQLATMSDEELAETIARVQKVYSSILNRPGAIVTAMGSEETLRQCLSLSDAFLAKLGNESPAPADYASAGDLSDGIALISDLPVAYDYTVYLRPAGDQLTGRDLVAQSVVTDRILMPELRFRLNAYGADCSVGDRYITLSSYRDPNVAETYQVFETIPEKLRALDLTQEELDGYITAAYSSAVTHPGPIGKARDAIDAVLCGEDPETNARLIREIKSVTADDIRAAADLFEKVNSEGAKSACLSGDMLALNPDLFATVLDYSGQ